MRALIIKILLRLANPFRFVDSEGEPLDIDGMWLDHACDQLVIQLRVEPPALANDLAALLSEVIDGGYLGCESPKIRDGRCWWCGRRSCADAMELVQKIRKALP